MWVSIHTGDYTKTNINIIFKTKKISTNNNNNNNKKIITIIMTVMVKVKNQND